MEFELIAHLERQMRFSERTFGPGRRTQMVCQHIRKELVEIESAPSDLLEWVDVVLLAFDGAWRAGYSPTEIAAAIQSKQSINEARSWPDWRTINNNEAIEHVRTIPTPPTTTPCPICSGRGQIDVGIPCICPGSGYHE